MLRRFVCGCYDGSRDGGRDNEFRCLVDTRYFRRGDSIGINDGVSRIIGQASNEGMTDKGTFIFRGGIPIPHKILSCTQGPQMKFILFRTRKPDVGQRLRLRAHHTTVPIFGRRKYQ